jgi:uncharacterized protein YecE (DUF72 family)
MTRIYAGTSGWAYPPWRPGFYPKGLSSRNFLQHYATKLNSVEVNYTFLRPVNQELLEDWIAATPDRFLFAVKAPQVITHFKRLRGAARVMKSFLRSLAPLSEANRLGPILFQLPPNMKCDVARLRAFLLTLPKGTRVAFEFRHGSWFAEKVYDLLRKHGAALCLAESEKIKAPDVRTADFHYLRLRKDTYAGKQVARRAKKLLHTGDVFIYFKHEDEPNGARNAEIVLRLAGKGRQT